MSDHIDEFDNAVGLIFAALYKQFPIRYSVDSTVMGNSISADEPGWLDKHSRQEALFAATMEWLIEAGYVWGKPHPDHLGYYTECVLSTKGLEILTLPSSLTGASDSIGKSLGNATGSMLTETIKDLAKEALTFGAQAAWAYGKTKF